MGILLDSLGRRRLKAGAIILGPDGAPCCCGDGGDGGPVPCTCIEPDASFRTVTLDYDLLIIEGGIVTRDEHITQTFYEQEQAGEWVCEWWGDWIPDVFAARIAVPAIFLNPCEAWQFGDGYPNHSGGTKATGSTVRGHYSDSTTDLYGDGTYMIYRTNMVVS